MDLFSKMYHLRSSGHTVRFHGHRWAGDRETVFHHSASVALILLNTVPGQCSANLLHAALTHDLEEGVTGDIPAPVKWEVGREILESLERRVRNHFEITELDLSEEEKILLKAADFLDACFTCLDQRLLGNTFIDTVFLNYEKYEESSHLLDFAPAMLKLYRAIRGAYFDPKKSGVQREGGPWVAHALEEDFWRGEEKE